WSRSEHRAAGSDDHLHLAARDLLPVRMPFRVSQMAMQDGYRLEPAAETADRLRGQAGFGNEHDCLSPVGDDFFNRSDIDFGLAASSYAVQQQCAMSVLPDDIQDRIDRPLLIVVHDDLCMDFGRLFHALTEDAISLRDDQSFFAQTLNRRGTTFRR